MHILIKRIVILLSFILSALAVSYPIDGDDHSGIRRLTGYQNAQLASSGPKLARGALLGWQDINLTLAADDHEQDFDELAVDPDLQNALDSIFKTRDPSYSVVVIDMSEANSLSWAAIRPDLSRNAGSVGKILTMLGLFDALARAFPDINEREQILKHTDIYAGNWVIADEHAVPKYSATTGNNQSSIINPDDNFKLSEWIDHMTSASANAAGSVVWREAMLMKQFANTYPLTKDASEKFFNETSKSALMALSSRVINEPMLTAKINNSTFQQGSLWTRTAKARVPGTQSFANARELARFMLRMEQGRLVDAWSSLEMKRYLYMTKRRYRYVYAPELSQSAIFFKSGSLYQCQAEEGFRCGKYMGNVRNMMNSVVVVESLPGAERYYRYIVAMMSNVLKVNSAWDHSRLGAAIHEAVLTRGSVKVKEEGNSTNIQDAGRS